MGLFLSLSSLSRLRNMICISRQKGMWESAQEEPHSLRGSGLRESAMDGRSFHSGWAMKLWNSGICAKRDGNWPQFWKLSILRDFYLLANVGTCFEILRNMLGQVHIVVFNIRLISRSLPWGDQEFEETHHVSRQLFANAEQNARYDCFMQVGFEDMTVVYSCQAVQSEKYWSVIVCRCCKYTANILTQSQALNVVFILICTLGRLIIKQPLIEY